MKNFIIYDNLGNIKRTGSCPDNLFALQALEDEFILEGTANQLTQKIEDGVIVEKVLEEPVISLDQLKIQKAASLNLSCKASIYAGYESTALGTEHHYPANDKDQVNMTASVVDSLNPENAVDWVTPFWCADSEGVWEYRLHTGAQIRKAGSDGKAHIVAQLQKNAELQFLVSQAVTPEELDLILW